MNEPIYDARAAAQFALVLGVNDAGGVQRATVQTTDGFVYDQVEVMQPFGFASVPPGDGAMVLLIAVGGDPGNWCALPVSNPSRRFGGQAPGETVVYGAGGSRVAFRANGEVEVQAATTVIIKAEGATIQANSVTLTSAAAVSLGAPGGVIITGNVEVDGDIHATGVVTGG